MHISYTVYLIKSIWVNFFFFCIHIRGGAVGFCDWINYRRIAGGGEHVEQYMALNYSVQLLLVLLSLRRFVVSNAAASQMESTPRFSGRIHRDAIILQYSDQRLWYCGALVQAVHTLYSQRVFNGLGIVHIVSSKINDISIISYYKILFVTKINR